jgi:hypothetical protein
MVLRGSPVRALTSGRRKIVCPMVVPLERTYLDAERLVSESVDGVE